jgi:hypothetical protein
MGDRDRPFNNRKFIGRSDVTENDEWVYSVKFSAAIAHVKVPGSEAGKVVRSPDGSIFVPGKNALIA